MVVRRWLPVPLVLLALAATGCGDEKTAKDVKDTATKVTTTGAGGGANASAAQVAKLVAGVGVDLKTAPKIIPTTGTPPSSLVSKDIVEGDGTPAKLGDTVSVRYTLVVWGGQKADSSWDRGDEPATFPLQEGGLIEGWIKGVPGMKPGGRRLLIVPPALGYGAAGQGAAVPPNATLVFVIDLVKAEKA